MGEMTYSAKHVEGFLASAEQAEILDGEAQFAAELADALSLERMTQGVEIDFDTDQAAFEKAIEYLQLDKHVKHDLGVISGEASSFSKSYVAIDAVQQAVSEVGLLATLNILQAVRWDVDKISDLHREVKVPEVAWSSLTLGQETEPDQLGATRISTDAMSIQLTQRTRYQPGFYDEHDNEDDYLHVLEDSEAYKEIVKGMAELMSSTEGKFAMPETSFVLSISAKHSPDRGFDALGGRFILMNGHIVPKPNRFDEDEDFDWSTLGDILARRGDEDGDDDDHGYFDEEDDRNW